MSKVPSGTKKVGSKKEGLNGADNGSREMEPLAKQAAVEADDESLQKVRACVRAHTSLFHCPWAQDHLTSAYKQFQHRLETRYKVCDEPEKTPYVEVEKMFGMVPGSLVCACVHSRPLDLQCSHIVCRRQHNGIRVGYSQMVLSCVVAVQPCRRWHPIRVRVVLVRWDSSQTPRDNSHETV
jgi:hypothetical protein